MDSIKFGTSGWRGIIARDFTFANVALVAQAIADSARKSETGYGKIYISAVDSVVRIRTGQGQHGSLRPTQPRQPHKLFST